MDVKQLLLQKTSMAQKYEVATQTMHYYKGEIPLKTKIPYTNTIKKNSNRTIHKKSVTQNEGKIGEYNP